MEKLTTAPCETCGGKAATMFYAAQLKTYAFCNSCHDELLELIESQEFADETGSLQ